ncbi:MAG TPA: glycosyltransferase family 87 protein [Anaerolineaceae bacterium]|nr:glycosyltransferase family 87 protein [Anaerolineaceae bacterium]
MSNYRRETIRAVIYIILGIIAVAGLGVGNYRFAQQNPGGNDFLVHWVGTRAFFVEGLSPYSDEVALRIQEITYGRAALPGEHELRVAYPLYSTLVFAPFAAIPDFTAARAAWMTVLELCLALMAYFSIRLTGWKPGFGLLVVFLLFTFFWYHGLRPLILGNAVPLVSLAIILALLAIRAGRDELAGLILGFATIKPQVVLLVFVFIVVWGIAQRRWKLVGWSVGTVAALTLGGMIFLPDWLIQNLREVIRYPSYNPPGTPGAALATWWPGVGRQVGVVITIVLAVLLLLEWSAARKAGFRHFLWTACFTLAVSQWIGVQTDPGNFIVLFLPLTLIFSVWQERWGRTGVLMTVSSILIILVGLWALFLGTLQESYQPIQSPIMFFPLPAFALIGLYWVRHYAIRPASLWIDLLKQQDA